VISILTSTSDDCNSTPALDCKQYWDCCTKSYGADAAATGCNTVNTYNSHSNEMALMHNELWDAEKITISELQQTIQVVNYTVTWKFSPTFSIHLDNGVKAKSLNFKNYNNNNNNRTYNVPGTTSAARCSQNQYSMLQQITSFVLAFWLHELLEMGIGLKHFCCLVWD